MDDETVYRIARKALNTGLYKGCADMLAGMLEACDQVEEVYPEHLDFWVAMIKELKLALKLAHEPSTIAFVEEWEATKDTFNPKMIVHD